MKINRIQLGEALLTMTLDQFQSVPAEAEIQRIFSRGFQEEIRSIAKKSESTAWRVWQTPVKRTILIAILIMVMLLTVACATPAIRNAIIDIFFIEDETAYGITFDPYEAVNTPHVIENVYLPSFEQEGYELRLKEYDDSRVECLWINDQDEYIHYWQSLIQRGVTDRTWGVMNAEATNRTTKNMNGHLVEIISNEAEQQYIAVWTDNRYIYKVDISVLGFDQETILKAIMDSLVEAETIS